MKDLFDGNLAWIAEMEQKDPNFFNQLAAGQSPEYLWIGCSDSRVPANVLTGLDPGKIFVHRNIANRVGNTDMNVLSVIYYAVKYLKVRHILVVGHSGCGGVMAAMSNNQFGFLDNWLTQIKDVYNNNKAQLEAISDENARVNKLIELNVVEQVRNVGKISFIQEEWAAGRGPQIHGLVYNLGDGKLLNLDVSITSGKEVEPIFQFA